MFRPAKSNFPEVSYQKLTKDKIQSKGLFLINFEMLSPVSIERFLTNEVDFFTELYNNYYFSMPRVTRTSYHYLSEKTLYRQTFPKRKSTM